MNPFVAAAMTAPLKRVRDKGYVLNRVEGTTAFFTIDHRSLERNKYAPWGRGANA